MERITLVVSDELKTNFRILLAQKNLNAKEYLTALLEKEIEKNKQERIK